MPDSDKLAIAAHLHVLLRRKTGRVTDTEWTSPENMGSPSCSFTWTHESPPSWLR